jgi:putative RecB family exonuclease
MEPQPLSVSQVNAYLACPLKYRFQYIDRIPKPWRAAALAFGSSIHAAVEWFWACRMAEGKVNREKTLEVFDADWYAANIDPLVFSDREPKELLEERGRAMLNLYLDTYEGTPPPLAVEQPFELELADPETGEMLGVFLRGVIDLIEEDGTLVDLKTAARSMEAGGLERHLQLSTYALVKAVETGTIPSLRLDMLFKTSRPRLERLPTNRTCEELSWTARLIRGVATAIESEQFFPSPSWRCGECEYFAHCQGWRGCSPEPIQIESINRSGGGAGVAAA